MSNLLRKVETNKESKEVEINTVNTKEVLKTVEEQFERENVLKVNTTPTSKKEVLLNPKKTYNEDNDKLISKQKTVIGKLTDLLSIKDIGSKESNTISIIIREYRNVIVPRNSNPNKQFISCLNGLKDINPKYFISEVERLGNLFEDLKNPTYEKLVFNKPTISIFTMKKYILNFFNKSIVDGFIEEKCEEIVNRIENSNDYTKTIYMYVKKGIFNGGELVNEVHNLIKNYKQTNSSGYSSLVGTKTESTIQKNIYRTLDKDIDLDKSNRLVSIFGGGGGDIVNIYPLVKDKDWDLVVNFYEKTPYQSHIDLYYNTHELLERVNELEVRFKVYTKNFTNGKHIKFLKIVREELNDLERKGIHNMDTSVKYLFLSSKVYGSNIEWKNNITQFSFSNDIKKSSKSILSRLEFGKHIFDSFKNVTIENEDFSIIYDKYNEETDFTISDPQYIKHNGFSMDESTRTHYGNTDFPHREHFKRFTESKSINKMYHNYFNYELEEETKKVSNLQFTKVKKLSRNSVKPVMTHEVIIHTVSKEQSVINPDYLPESETGLVS